MTDVNGEVSESDIAIVGASGRFAGSPTLNVFWDNIQGAVECIRDLSDAELRAGGVDEAQLKDPAYVKRGGILDGVDMFDAGFFGFGPKDAAILDPQLRHFLECSWEALEVAGHPPSRFDGSVGVFAGCGMNSYFMFNILTNQDILDSTGMFLLRHTGNDRDFLSTTLSYKLNLRGPSLSVQTACSTSLVAIHLAVQSLLSGESDMALAGGVTINVPHVHGYRFEEGEILAQDGHCRSFSQDSTGTVLASGVGIVVLRRLTDAIEDGDDVLAVIKGVAINNDGSQKVGYLAPSVDGQAAAIAEALAVADIDADSISYIETHGTGTSVGDPIEVSGLTQAYREFTDRNGFCGIGSNKPNFGHTDTAAGVASVLKVMLALQHKKLPPSINYSGPNPEIDFENSPFYVNDELREWKAGDTPRRAGISSLGVGGTNAHAILEEAPVRKPSDPPKRSWQILAVSAKSAASADAGLGRLGEYLGKPDSAKLADVAFTLQDGRESFEVRRAFVCDSPEDGASVIAEGAAKRIAKGVAKGRTPSIVFMFPGGGAQYPNMGLGLYESEPVYREAIDRCTASVAPQLPFDLHKLMFPGDKKSPELTERLKSLDAALPAIFATSYALARLWMSWGIQPTAMTGHSMGEYTAACLAGVMSLEDASRIVATRAQLMTEVIDDGLMLSVPLPEAELVELMSDDLDLGVINGPSLCVVSGSTEVIQAFQAKLAEMDIDAQVLNLRASAHSRFLDPILTKFHAALEKIEMKAPERPFISNLSGTWITDEEVQTPEYWVRHLRQTVRFSDGLATLLEDPDRILLEVGPGQTLSSLARQQPTQARVSVASLRHPEEASPDERFLLTAACRLWAAGTDFDWSVLRAENERRIRVPLPTYAFDRQRYWVEPGAARHGAVGGRPRIERLDSIDNWFSKPVWKRVATESTAKAWTPKKWLIFADSMGVAAAVVARIAELGGEAIVVREGDGFYFLDESTYALSPEVGVEGYKKLIQDLVAKDALPDRILHLWTVTGDATAKPDSNIRHHSQERGFYSLFFLAQALGDLENPPEIEIVVASNGMQKVGDEPLQYPSKATLLGPVRVIPRELTTIRCLSVDLELPESGEATALATQLIDEFGWLGASSQTVAYRKSQRWEQVIDRVSLPAPLQSDALLQPGGVFLITGGLGGIGLSVAEHLARTVKAKLVLMGRTALPERRDWDTWLADHSDRDRTSRKLRKLLELEVLGAEVHVAVADIANLEAVTTALASARKQFGEITGVIHAAGVVDDGLLQMKSVESAERIFAAKLHGTLVLDQVFRDKNLDFMVLFSSTSSILGAAGQIDYTAANAFLNAYAESRSGTTGTKVIAIDWGVWADVGMAKGLVQQMGDRGDNGALTRTRVAHPMLGERLEVDSGDIIFSCEYTTESLWVLDEHRTEAGNALVPGTGFLEIVRAALHESLGIARSEITDATFIAPFAVDDGTSRELRVTLSPIESHWSFKIESRITANDPWEVHATGGITPLVTAVPDDLPFESLTARCDVRRVKADSVALVTAQETFLRFGPRWRSVRAIAYGQNEAVARLELDYAFRDDLELFALHPALLDMATGYAMELIEGYQVGQTLWVPMSYGNVKIHAPLTSDLHSWVRSDSSNHIDRATARFDVTLCDSSGRVLVEIVDFTLRKLSQVEAFAPSEATKPERTPSPAEALFLETVGAGIRVTDGMKVFDRVLGRKGPAQVLVSSIDLNLLQEAGDATAKTGSSGIKFDRPELESEYEAPRDDIEKSLADIWQSLLDLNQIGVHDDFFEIGGHSLIAVRLFAKIKQLYEIDWGIAMLFEAPTIAQCASLIGAEIGDVSPTKASDQPVEKKEKFRFLTPLANESATGAAPFFLVAGMFGNVLNLRHLGHHLGKDAPIYAIQAQGLLSGEKPHTRFEDMATAYLKEVRKVQPVGPYYLGGFSGGGITALEMAQQLQAQGEEIGILVMLDTPPPGVPKATRMDRMRIHWRKLRSKGPKYIQEHFQRRANWMAAQERKQKGEALQDMSPAEHRSELIEAAFYEALEHYTVKTWNGVLTLFVPPLGEHYDMGNRILSLGMEQYDELNHWEQYVNGTIDLHRVTGDHDSMVLEPHVRHLSAHLRASLAAARQKMAQYPQTQPIPVVSVNSIALP